MQYFIGQTRFSLYIPNSKSWNTSQQSEIEYLANLYSDSRMEPRVDIFINKLLPNLETYADKYFYKHIVSYSSHLPDKWKDLLFEAAAKYKFLFLNQVDAGENNPILNILKNQQDGSVAYFRVDDDDLLSKNYLNQLANYNHECFKNMAVSFACGAVAYYENGYSYFRSIYRPNLAIGQAYIGTWLNGKLDLPWGLSHHNIDRFIPTIVDSRSLTFLWTHHGNQDSHVGSQINVIKELNNFPVMSNVDELTSNFPCLINDIESYVNQKKSIFSIKNINTIGNIDFKVDSIKKEYFEIKFSFAVNDIDFSATNSIILSFTFDDDANVVSGLTLSPNKNIGWYKYLTVLSGEVQGNFSFVLDNNVGLKSINLIFWNKSIENILIKELNIL